MNLDCTTQIDYVIDGIEAALELERELGLRVVECDRSLLASIEKQKAQLPVSSPVSSQVVAAATQVASVEPAPDNKVSGKTGYDFVFLHHRALSAAGLVMMEKIIGAMKKNPATAPIIVDSPLPNAKVYVVLGSFALKKFFPSLRGAPGQWLKSESGAEVLISNSPEYILRFGVETDAVKKIKQDMWRSLKTVEQHLASH